MIARNSIITQADLDALAQAANDVVGPMPDDFVFNNFDEDILPPSAVTGEITYGAGGYFAEGLIVVCRVHSYKTIASVKHYSKLYATGSVLSDNSANPFTIEWDWTPPVDAVDGYVFTLLSWVNEPLHATGHYYGAWKEVTALPFTDDYDSLTLDYGDAGALSPSRVNPVMSWLRPAEATSDVNAGPWLRELGRIRRGIYSNYTPDATWLVSGPWCVSVGPRLRYGSDDTIYGEVEFWYALDDHAGDVEFETLAELGTTDQTLAVAGTATVDVLVTQLSFTLVAAHTATGRIVFSANGTIAGGSTHVLSVTAGAVTIVTETWTVAANTLTLDFEFDLPTGASNVQVDIDLNDVTNPIDSSADMYCDVSLGTETITPSSVDAIHPTSLTKKAVPTAIDFTLGPVTFKGVDYYPSFRITGDVEGVWVAKTRWVFGVHTYLDCDLPQYYSTSLVSTARDEVENTDASAVVTPAVSARSSLWPVFRDTDFGSWKQMGNAVRPVPYWELDLFHTCHENIRSAEASGVTSTESVFVPSDYEKLIISASPATVTVYVSTATNEIDPNNPATYDASAVGSVTLPDDFAWAGNGTVWYLMKNNTATATSVSMRTVLCIKDDDGVYPGDTPVFFNTLTSGLSAFENYSYNIATTSPRSLGKIEIPQSGYCVYEVVIRRSPVWSGSVMVIPSTGEAALTVKLGMMHDATFATAGTFVEFDTFTILADEGSVTTTVFWPVLSGAALAYQCDEIVDVMAYVNFQPLVISHFYPDGSTGSGDKRGRYCGEAQWPPGSSVSSRMARWSNSCSPGISQLVTLPISSDLYNDTENLLAVL